MAQNDGTTKKTTSRRPFWQKHLRAWSQSGLTQADYCRQHQLSAPAFGWWKRQLQGKPRSRKRPPAAKQPERGDKTPARFVEVQHGSHVDRGGGPAVYEVLLSRGRAIRVPKLSKRACAWFLLTVVLLYFLLWRPEPPDLTTSTRINRDYYDGDYYAKAADPAIDRENTLLVPARVLRGGCWYYESQYGRCAYRRGRTPLGRRHVRIGFRAILVDAAPRQSPGDGAAPATKQLANR